MINRFENDGKTLKVMISLDKRSVSNCVSTIIIEYFCGKYDLSMDSQKKIEDDFYNDKVYDKIDRIINKYEKYAKEYKDIYG